MKVGTMIVSEASPLVQTRIADYVELIKPRITVMVLVTVATGGLLASRGAPDWSVLCHTLIGTALVAAGASALNQLLERESDGLMQRTENRPLPAGRLQPLEVLIFGGVFGVGGVAYLAVLLSHWLAAFVAAFTFLSYVFVYTPLKRRTSLNTLVGAVPGALPPVIGWAAVRGSIDPEIVALFAIIFLWQVPHFLAIAWIYREDYERAGLCMLPVLDRAGVMSSRQMVAYCVALIPVSLAPFMLGRTGGIYLVGAILLGVLFLGFTVSFSQRHSVLRARSVVRVSLLYLPALLALLLLDGV
ncbi:MAG TPA: heme o synthase [Gemmataceae bacterium]|nr:heme o synthase [Gemmataceae bacterium]